MKIVRTVEEFRELRKDLTSVGFVPTMGALHEGHLALIRKSAEENAETVISVFVNPLQFGPSEDFDKYPRQEEEDISLATSAGATVGFFPKKDDFLNNFLTNVVPAGAAKGYEGESRPGHFAGVATIVTKLVNVVCPDVAYFGLKDLQQCAVIRQVFRDLNINVQLSFLETVREESGLALSSRNAYLKPESRLRAGIIYEVLCVSSAKISDGQPPSEVCLAGRKTLQESGFDVEYFDLVDFETMKPLNFASNGARLMTAVRFEGVRLIDNVVVRPR